jgi:hypothetical protein
MPGQINDVGAKAALDYLCGISLDLGSTATRTTYLALLTVAPTDSTTMATMTEVAATGYARQPVSWTAAALTGGTLPAVVSNSAQIVFGPFTASGGIGTPATYGALVTTATGTTGQIITTWQFDAPGNAAQNASLIVAPAALSLSLG